MESVFLKNDALRQSSAKNKFDSGLWWKESLSDIVFISLWEYVNYFSLMRFLQT